MKEIIKNMILRQIGKRDRAYIENMTIAMLNKGYIGENEVIEIENALDTYYAEKDTTETNEVVSTVEDDTINETVDTSSQSQSQDSEETSSEE